MNFNYLLKIVHEDQDMIEMDFHVEDPWVIRFVSVDLLYFLICELIVVQYDFLQVVISNDVV